MSRADNFFYTDNDAQQPHQQYHLLPVLQGLITGKGELCLCAEQNQIKPQVRLSEAELWRTFHAESNEMIINKGGRRMFPVINFSISGLEPLGMYCVLVEFVQLGMSRVRFVNGEWLDVGTAQPRPTTEESVCVHQNSPNFGEHWMKKEISFEKLKLANKETTDRYRIRLNSHHKYQPVIHIVRLEVSTQVKCYTSTFTFPETQFVTVTAYQNNELTALKIKHNPFAKAFLEKTLKSPTHSPITINNQCNLYQNVNLQTNYQNQSFGYGNYQYPPIPYHYPIASHSYPYENYMGHEGNYHQEQQYGSYNNCWQPNSMEYN